MPNVLNALGLQLATRDELIAYFTLQYETIYGSDINLASNTPDGQMMNIFVQTILDMQDLTAQVYNSFDPDQAIGVILDQRVTINGIQRQTATYTLTPITINLSRSVNLYGLDGLAPGSPREDGQEVYTVADNAGNRWQLRESQIGVGPGVFSYEFTAQVPGAQLTVPNTITTQVTIVLGVTSVNNPTTYSTLGENEETDAALRVRRQRSVSLASQGYFRGLIAAIENITGVTSVFVYENTTDVVDSDGVPGHTIWVIVAGTGADAEIAQAIYTKRNAGAGMKGDITYNITQIDGSIFTVRWDEVVIRNVFIRFTTTSINGVSTIPVQLIRDGLPALLIPGVNESLNVNSVATAVQEIDPNTLVTNAGISLGSTQTIAFSGVAASGTFTLVYNGNATAAINWNDAVGTIETKIQAVTGLSTVTVTGSIASQLLTFDFSGLSNVLTLLYQGSNSLQTSAPAAITLTFDAGYAPTLATPTKLNQLVLTSANIIITPMTLLPASNSIAGGANIQFVAAGGYKNITYSISVNTSGGSINSTTGLYTAGFVAGNDTIRAVDSFGNSATATVAVA